ncbi:methanogenesis marker 6 protein [Methanospirillum lacunae]|uniref:Methanogenesis marker 6 protein n=1 Tax=Methanospirillum lacunae TaxID=668570 RepID=A0A2V2MYU9_9EURY|nr:methanogenesis marker 6 protein [Methanospirillum lacunae]PWR70596.1 methanogenesis marker 6 protein [Methanospirillum lacunae]
MKQKIPPLYQGTVTKYVFVESYKTTPDDLTSRAYEVSEKVMIKETCFGLQITGEESEVERVIAHIRKIDPSHIFVKDRGFPPGDPRRCRANLGGARPGYFGHEFEMKVVKWVSKGIEAINSEDPALTLPLSSSVPEEPPLLDLQKLKQIIDAEVP